MTREEAIKNIKLFFTGINIALSNKTKEALVVLIPELRESEDERIRKGLIETLKTTKTVGELKFILPEPTREECIAYLEKQKEKEIPKWMPKFLDELRSKKHYFDWDEHRDIEGSILAIIDFIAPDYFTEKDKKEQKPILEVFGFKVGDAVRLKDGDGRKHIIKSFEEVEGLHGPNFYHVEFEDNSARDGIYPGEEYPNGFYTQMEKIEEEQKSIKWTDLTWKDINELEEIINHVHYEFRNGISAEGFGKEVLEQFRNMKEDAEVDACEQKPSMIQWKGDNLKEVIDFTGKSPMFNKWFKSFEEYEEYVHSHGNIFKLFNDDGSHYEVPVGAWIVKTPDGCNVASKAVFRQKPADWSYPYGRNETVDRLVAIAECLEVDGDCLFNGYSGTECGKFLRDLARKQVEYKPAECIKTEELAEHIKAEFESFRNLLKKKGIDYQPAEAYWTDFARLFVSSAKKLQKPAGWSEKDKKMLDNLIWAVHMKSISPCDEMDDRNVYEKYESFLKSLRPSLKPSEEQMEALRTAMDRNDSIGYHLGRLYEQLKKLM